MFSADSALAVLCTCEDSEVQDALRNRPEAITKLRTALDPLPSLRGTNAPGAKETGMQHGADTALHTHSKKSSALPSQLAGFCLTGTLDGIALHCSLAIVCNCNLTFCIALPAQVSSTSRQALIHQQLQSAALAFLVLHSTSRDHFALHSLGPMSKHSSESFTEDETKESAAVVVKRFREYHEQPANRRPPHSTPNLSQGFQGNRQVLAPYARTASMAHAETPPRLKNPHFIRPPVGGLAPPAPKPTPRSLASLGFSRPRRDPNHRISRS